MKRNKFFITLVILLFASIVIVVFAQKDQVDDNRFITYNVNSKMQAIHFYWKDDKYQNFGSIQNLRLWLKKNKRTLVFAMNGGMYKPDGSPQGLFIENGKILSSVDTSKGMGNFYLQPNGVFYILKDNTPVVCKTTDFKYDGNVKYATQSGPMLLIDGQIHPAFKKGSANMNIRNGVGILPDNKIVFAMSKEPINLYDFADYFKNIGCKNALYLDGLVSRTYLPEKEWMQTDGNFGVIIGVTTTQNWRGF